MEFLIQLLIATVKYVIMLGIAFGGIMLGKTLRKNKKVKA